MPATDELCLALEALVVSKGSAKVSFYYVDEDGVRVKSGAIYVGNGVDAYIDHQLLEPLAAANDILKLALVKIATLRMSEIRLASSIVPMDLSSLISVLREKPKAPVAPAQQTSVVRAEVNPAPVEHVAVETMSVAAIKGEVLRLLEPLFGIGAGKKVDELAIDHPPSEHSHVFLLHCKRHAAIMLGERNAEALFKPLADQLELERNKRRR